VLGRISREGAKRAVAFDMRVCIYDITWAEAFAQQWGTIRQPAAQEMLRHMHLSVVAAQP